MPYVITIIAYLIVLLTVGILLASRAKSQEGFMVANRQLTAPVLVATLLAGMIVTVAWEIARKIMGDFPLGMPAIYPALICSLACLICISYLEPPPDESKWKPFMN